MLQEILMQKQVISHSILSVIRILFLCVTYLVLIRVLALCLILEEDLWSPCPVDFTTVLAFNSATVEKMKIYNDKGKTIPVQAYYGPKVFQDFEALRFQDSRHMKVVTLSALGTSCLYPPGNTRGTHFR